MKTSLTKYVCIGGLFAVFALLGGCESHYSPKPRGYFRVDFPEKHYLVFESDCGFAAEVPRYSQVELIRSSQDSCWFNLTFPRNNAKVHFTYLAVYDELNLLLEDAYQLAFKHESKADAIQREAFSYPDQKVHGMIYDLKGDVASPLQFYLTDSASHFLRGSLYFNHVPNADSLKPALDFIREDVVHLIQTLEWQ